MYLSVRHGKTDISATPFRRRSISLSFHCLILRRIEEDTNLPLELQRFPVAERPNGNRNPQHSVHQSSVSNHSAKHVSKANSALKYNSLTVLVKLRLKQFYIKWSRLGQQVWNPVQSTLNIFDRQSSDVGSYTSLSPVFGQHTCKWKQKQNLHFKLSIFHVIPAFGLSTLIAQLFWRLPCLWNHFACSPLPLTGKRHMTNYNNIHAAQFGSCICLTVDRLTFRQGIALITF